MRVAIHDLAGRLLRILCDTERTAGIQEIAWDGRDDAGISVASGVYLYRIKTATTAIQGKMTLMR